MKCLRPPIRRSWCLPCLTPLLPQTQKWLPRFLAFSTFRLRQSRLTFPTSFLTLEAKYRRLCLNCPFAAAMRPKCAFSQVQFFSNCYSRILALFALTCCCVKVRAPNASVSEIRVLGEPRDGLSLGFAQAASDPCTYLLWLCCGVTV